MVAAGDISDVLFSTDVELFCSLMADIGHLHHQWIVNKQNQCRLCLQGEIFAAEGYAKTTGRVGVCIATSGPGATNLVTGLADAMMDSVPLVAITGQVSLVQQQQQQRQ